MESKLLTSQHLLNLYLAFINERCHGSSGNCNCETIFSPAEDSWIDRAEVLVKTINWISYFASGLEMFVLQCRVDSIISLLGKYSCWWQPQQSPGAEDAVMTSWAHISAGETALGESRPLKCLQTETKTCIVWRTGIWGGYCIRVAGFGSYSALCVLCLGRRKTSEAVVIIYFLLFKVVRATCFNMHQAALGRLFPSSPSDGSQLSANTEQLWMTMVESAEVTCVFLHNGQYSLLIEWEVSVIEWKKVFSRLYSQQLV